MEDDPKTPTENDELAGASGQDKTVLPETPPADATGDGLPSLSYGKNDLFPEIAILWLALNLIHAAPRRVRRGLEKQIKGVARSIEAYGFRVPILVRTRSDGKGYDVVDGHVRLEAAKRLGAKVIPCILVDDLSDVQIRRMSLSLNKLQETGDWDREALRLEIEEIIEISGDVEIPGFELPEIEAMQFGGGETEAPDPADDVSELVDLDAPVVSRFGYIWLLGDHVLVCGSARDGTSLAEILGGTLADVVFIDPPYNVRINGNARSSAAGFEEFAEASGEMSSAEFISFLVNALKNLAAVLRPGAVLFVCMDWRHIGEMSSALETLKLDLLNICVWVKTQPGMGSLYRSQHELVFVARKGGAGHINNIQLGKHGRNRTNVWPYAGATGGPADPDDDFNAHPTVKPIRMVMEALLDVTEPGDVVIDSFLGSGTTLLAAERTRRRCVGVEIEPRYVDLAIRRWQDMTGLDAVHAENGMTFDEIAAIGGQGVSDGEEGF